MKLARLGCKTMWDGIVVSGVFLFGALVLLLMGRFFVPDLAYMREIVLILGLLLLFSAPLILIATYLRTVRKAALDN